MLQPYLIPDDWTSQAAGATILRNFDFSRALQAGDSLVAPLTVTAAPVSGILDDLVIDHQTIGPGQLVSFRCAGGSYYGNDLPNTYIVTCTVATIFGETIIASSYLTVEPR